MAPHESEPDSSDGFPNLQTPTLGGKQWWSDELVFRQWRIQRNAITGHCRLLDERNHRRAWGTFDQCRSRLDALKRELDLPPVTGKVVIVLHGLGRSRSSMKGMCKYLAEQGGFTVLNVSYASTRGDVDEHAASLARVIEHLEPGVEQIDFVAHSLGNLVIRRYLAWCERHERQLRPDARFHRMVMLGPPNRGARLAELLGRTGMLQLVLGRSAGQLARSSDAFQKKLATPRFEFGIIAGGRCDPKGRNPLLDGDDDLIVRVDETRLAGARDFVVLPVVHAWIMDDRKVREYTLRFLKHGYFISEEARQPIADPQGTEP